MKKGLHRLEQQPFRKKRMLGSAMRQRVAKDNLESVVSRLARRGVLGRAARLAVEKQFSLGLPAVWMENGIIYKVFPDGRKVKLGQQTQRATKVTQQRFYIDK